ncbi:mucin-associated surface protein (MASP) [Trypanosoma cruzi]|nr:mucin-associated surface protein (MASP) [Trypanosoma cruzi]RNC43952.1 mucin-associated surface protein (MASP) [Trypanosoma cruzi]
MDDAGLARGMDDEVVFARRDCVSSAALRGVAAAVPAGEDGGVGASGTPSSDAGQPPVGDAGSGTEAQRQWGCTNGSIFCYRYRRCQQYSCVGCWWWWCWPQAAARSCLRRLRRSSRWWK